MKAFNSNFLSAMHSFRNNEVYCQRIWRHCQSFLLAFHSNFSSGMHGFRDNEVLLQAGYDISARGASRDFHDGFWKSDHNLPIAFHRNFLSAMHGFRDNEDWFPTGYDVIVISLPRGASHSCCWRIVKEHIHGSLTYFAYLLPFRSYSTFICDSFPRNWQCKCRPIYF